MPDVVTDYCNIEGGTSDNDIEVLNVISTSATVFVDAANDNYRLDDDSVHINAGHPTAFASGLIAADDFDIDGDSTTNEPTPELDLNHRIMVKIDMGAYEFRCPEDIDPSSTGNVGDGIVGVGDLLALLAAWGSCEGCIEDINGDDEVNVTDLLLLLAAWSAECPSDPHTVQGPDLSQHGGEYGPVSDKWDNVGGVRYRLAAEDFKTTDAVSVSSVQWFGFYEDQGSDCEDGYTDGFTITYYESQIHGTTEERIPGSVIASHNVTPTRADSNLTVNGMTLYIYAATHTAVSFESGGCYFIEIKNSGGDTDGSSGCHWRWAWSGDGDIDYSVVKPESASSYAAASSNKKVKNLTLSLGIEFTWEQIDVLCPTAFQ